MIVIDKKKKTKLDEIYIIFEMTVNQFHFKIIFKYSNNMTGFSLQKDNKNYNDMNIRSN